MAIVVIGGQAKGVGKTGVVCALISAMPERHWTAIKISSAHGGPGDLRAAGQRRRHMRASSEERDPTTGADSSRYLAAGAARAFWVRTAEGQLAQAMPGIRAAMAAAENVILESNSILGWLQPDLYAIVLDPRIADFKASALRYLDRADAILLCAGSTRQPNWSGVSHHLDGAHSDLPGRAALLRLRRIQFLRGGKTRNCGENRLLPGQ